MTKLITSDSLNVLFIQVASESYHQFESSHHFSLRPDTPVLHTVIHKIPCKVLLGELQRWLVHIDNWFIPFGFCQPSSFGDIVGLFGLWVWELDGCLR